MSDWGQGAKNNTIGYGQGACDNTIGWGTSQKDNNSWSGDTDISGCSSAAGLAQIDNLNSMQFDGGSDYIDLGTSLSLANEYTISCWININNTTAGAKVIIYKGTNTSTEFALEVNRTSGKLSTLGASSGPVFTSNTTLAPGVWYHAALTKAVVGGIKTYTFFLNGQPDGTGTTTVAPNYLSGITAIGRFGSSSGGYFNGSIDEVGLFNTALTEAEVQSIYNATAVVDGVNKTADLSQLTTPPVAWYRM